MPEIGQVRCGDAAAEVVVDPDARDEGRVARLDGAVEQDEVEAALDEGREVVERRQRGAEDDVADAVVPQLLHVAELPPGIALAVAEEDVVAVAECRLLELAGERTPERVAHRRHDEADRLRLAGPQLPRGAVGTVVECPDGRKDPIARLGLHAVGATVEDVRDGARGDARCCGDLLDRHLVGHDRPFHATASTGIPAAVPGPVYRYSTRAAKLRSILPLDHWYRARPLLPRRLTRPRSVVMVGKSIHKIIADPGYR
jgi:hypothetical protein